MRKISLFVASLLAALTIGGGVAVAAGSFDSSTPPSPAGWMTRPCKATADSTPLTQNCYWTTSMGTWTDAHGNPVTVGFWIRKVPNQPLICYIYSPDDEVSGGSGGDTCYSTTDDRAVFLNKTFYLNNAGSARR